MSRGFYLKLSLQNIKKNRKIYLPYLLMTTFITAMYYIIYSLSVNKGLNQMKGGSSLRQILDMGCGIVGFFSLIFLFYINSFIMKRRKKEFGLYSILGMEKRHLGKVVLWETAIIGVFSIIMGILVGILLNKLIYLGLLHLFQAEISLGFEIAPSAVLAAVRWIGIIQILIFLNGLRQIWFLNPIELLHGENVGEREPKTKIIMAVLGLLCLGAGYYLAVATVNPMAAMFVLMIAILLVMAGTYLTFTAGSIALLKLLRKNKNYYYKTRHFVSVSGMIYRMKQNAVGLANVAILSTGVLLMISTTFSLYLDLNNIIENRYPRDINVSAYRTTEDETDKVLQSFQDVANGLQLETENLFYYSDISMGGILQGEELLTNLDSVYGLSNSDVRNIYILTLEDYNRINAENKNLEEGEVLVYSNRTPYKHQKVKLLGKTFTVKEHLKDFTQSSSMSSDVIDSLAIVVKNSEIKMELADLQQTLLNNTGSGGYCNNEGFYGIDVKGDKDQKAVYQDRMKTELEALSSHYRIEDKEAGRMDFLGMYSGLLFIGIFLSLLFIVATVLIIYYKQISEGYDDRGRFEIMQKVGMDKREIRRSINSQVLQVFFLPLVTAGIHTGFAFPIMRRLMLMLGLNNTNLYLAVTGVCFLVFAVFYAMIYKMTARVYYKIVS